MSGNRNKIILLLFSTYFILEVNLKEERSELDNFIVPYREFRILLHQLSNSQRTKTLRILSRHNKLQKILPVTTTFRCTLSEMISRDKPRSVHALRPGDIDVIAALGDSITAGIGLAATDLISVFVEDRGKVFSIGGEGTWRNYRTLPNILKVFNPNLIGYSLNTSISIQRASQFNVAESGAVSKNLPYMTKVLIKRIQSDRRVNMDEDWKMVTLFIGHNDFCSEICYFSKPEEILQKHKSDLLQSLRLLRDHIPKTIVNIIPALHLKNLANAVPKPQKCNWLHKLNCPCVFALPHSNRRDQYFDIMTRWQLISKEVADYLEFNLDNFTINLQMFTTNLTLPINANGNPDYTYLAEDCFHPSQKFHAVFANSLWNNMLEPHEQKSGLEFNLKKLKCPTKENPYIYTRKNSITISKNN